MAKTAPLGIVGLVLIAGSLLLLWFVILSGVVHSTPLDKTYFLRADTSGITGARQTTQWTYFYFCGDNNRNCGSAHAAPAFGDAWDSRPSNAPDALVGSYGGHTTSKKFYYLWRFGWVFLLLALFFEVLTFFSAFLACCGRLGSAIAGIMSSIALFCFSIGVSITTATFVLARNKFKDAGRDASLGRYAFGFLWGSYAALIICQILFCAGCLGSRKKDTASTGRKGYTGLNWRRRRSQRSYDGRRVKEDYP